MMIEETSATQLENIKLLNRKEVALILGVDAKTLDKYVARGKFPTPARVLGRPRWTETAVRDFLQKKFQFVGQKL